MPSQLPLKILDNADALSEGALERREDMSLSAIAETRDHAEAKKVKHEDVWK